MFTIPEIDEIAKRATERIAKDFAESGFSNPPVVTHGIARAVLEAAEQSIYLTGGILPTSQTVSNPQPLVVSQALPTPPTRK